MADPINYLEITSYKAGSSSGERAAIPVAELTIMKQRLCAISFEESLLNFPNLGVEDWDTIIAANPGYAQLFNETKAGLARLWFNDVEKGETSILISADWVAANFAEVEDLAEVAVLLPSYTERKNENSTRELVPTVTILLNSRGSGLDWSNENLLTIRPNRTSYTNFSDNTFRVTTEFGLSFIVNEQGRGTLLTDPAKS
jgi:hypothetical protein